MISAGNNQPDFRTQTPANTAVLVALHSGVPIPNSPENDAALALLRQKGFVADGSSGPRAAVFVAGLEDARWLSVDPLLVNACAALIADHLGAIRTRVSSIANFATIPFEHMSLLVLSDVMVDSWQIDFVEQGFVRAERPLRSGGRYYYAVEARRADSPLEAFDVYGNQGYFFGDIGIGLYGNQRLTATALPTLSDADLQARFGLSADQTRNGQQLLAHRLVAAVRDNATLTPAEIAGFRSLGLVDERGAVITPILSDADQEALNGVSAIIRDDYVAALNSRRDALRGLYLRSPYAHEVSFEEYLIWWYHVFYTAVTDRLIAMRLIRVPAAGVATYIMI